MALASSGLQTQLWNNNLKSMLLLLSFPLLIMGLAWVCFFIEEWFVHRIGTLGFVRRGTHFNIGLIPAEMHRSMSEIIVFATRAMLEAAPWICIGVSLWFVVALFSHEGILRRASKSHPVARHQYYRVYNMLENLSIAAGMTMPKLFIIDSPHLNAYASGIDPQTYAVTLTQGIIDSLEDEELEAVIAHELAHIQNGDARLMIIAIVFVGIFSFLLSILNFGETPEKKRKREPANLKGKELEEWLYRRGDDPFGLNPTKDNGWVQFRENPTLSMFRLHIVAGVIHFIALCIATVGHWLAIGIRMAFSRKRELVADAHAAKLTKNPSALISALKKIQADTHYYPVEMLNAAAIANKPDVYDWFSTHPPLEVRVQALVLAGGRDGVIFRSKPVIEPGKQPLFGRKPRSLKKETPWR